MTAYLNANLHQTDTGLTAQPILPYTTSDVGHVKPRPPPHHPPFPILFYTSVRSCLSVSQWPRTGKHAAPGGAPLRGEVRSPRAPCRYTPISDTDD
ncbi:uncharacterized [Tachysurus ichikawai]